MTADPRPDADLDALRTKGDPALEIEWTAKDALQYLKEVRTAGLAPPGGIGALGLSDSVQRALRAAVDVTREEKNQARHGFPEAELAETRRLFRRYGTEIGGALLLAGLPEAYAAKWGARVLAATGELNSNPTRRIRATAQFLVSVLGPVEDIGRAWDEDGGAFQAVVGLRLFHAAVRVILKEKFESSKSVRDLLGPQNAVAVNQEDLVATRLIFAIGVFEVLERFGISWSRDEQLAYLTAWRFIGGCLGIVSDDSFDPETVEGARMLLDRLRNRQWALPGQGGQSTPLEDRWSDVEPGRMLVHALLGQLAGAMPKATRGWPLAVMRQLSPPQVVARLGLGASGPALSMLDQLPALRTSSAPFTTFARQNPLKGRMLRMMANEVTRRTVIAFVLSDDQPPFVLPELGDWTSGIRSR